MRRKAIVLLLLIVLPAALWLRGRLLPIADDDLLLNLVPPPEDVRNAAIDETSHLTQELQRHFDPGDDFPPMPKPGPHDWLANNHEGGQTFKEFRQAEPNRPHSELTRKRPE